MKRVLITVSGGVADFVADDGIDIVIYDFDVEKHEIVPVPTHFADLAAVVGAEVEVPEDLTNIDK